MNLSKFVDEKSYKAFAGSSWPSYAGFLSGERPVGLEDELNQFVEVMKQRYADLVEVAADDLASANQERQGQVFFAKQVPASLRCRIPWNTMGINSNGNVFICESPSWVPKFVGNLLEVDDVYQVLNSEIARSIRWEIVNQRYFYCNHKISRILAPRTRQIQTTPTTEADLLPLPVVDNEQVTVTEIPKELIFDFDWTCNFKCPSCRTELLNYNKHHIIRPINNSIAEKIKRLVIDKIDTQPVNIRWAGGEPFISEVYVDLMEYCVASGKNIKHVIQTNGSYLIAKSDLLEKLLPHIDQLRVSFDAGTADTYKNIRVNGVWEHLLKNVEHVQSQIARLGLKTQVVADFVVQKENYQEIPQLVEVCKQLGIKRINYQRMWNWGTWPIEQFHDMNIHDAAHPEHHRLLEIFKTVNHRI